MHQKCPLAFLAIYVPIRFLVYQLQGFHSWEQGYRLPNITVNPVGSQFPDSPHGVTAIRTIDIFHRDRSRRHSSIVAHLGNGTFSPNGVSLGQVFLDMISCGIGSWIKDDNKAENPIQSEEKSDAPDFSMDLDMSGYSEEDLDRLTETVKKYLNGEKPK